MAFDQSDTDDGPGDGGSVSGLYGVEGMLPDPLPDEPLGLLGAWFDEAVSGRVQPNPNAMSLATVDADGTPSVRVVLCKIMDRDRGYVVFFTNYRSRKAAALDSMKVAAAVMHWDTLDRQVRIEGPVVRSPGDESDGYFASRPLESRLGAVVSEQSRPVGSRAELIQRIESRARDYGLDPTRPLEGQDTEIVRPQWWGGYRLWARRVELWAAAPGRVHDRARWSRAIELDEAGEASCGAWERQRLQP